MKKILLIFNFSFCIFHFAQAQNPGEWVWLSGDQMANSPGVFGTQGISSPLNVPPAAYCASSWTDTDGKFWLYGGIDGNGEHGDLWRYDPLTNEWTWMKGSGITNDTGF